jgi:apolipoprotein N-acyltransferase
LEAIDPRVISKMMRRNADGHKAIMLIANLSNDGWFAVQEKHQHLQTIVFRSIEHRVPLVRSSNTGISGWIDSTGRLRETISPNTSGAITVQVDLDHRLTVYARIGDVFAGACVVLTALGIVVHVLMRRFKSTLLCSVENMHPENHHAIGDGP